jgi:uncharacterized protein (TIGR03086 family)
MRSLDLDVFAVYQQCHHATVHALHGVDTQDLARPTPCPGWDVRALTVHVADVADALAGLARTGSLDFSASDPLTVTDPAALALSALAGADEEIANTERRDWATSAAESACIELLAHACDLATACGRPVQVSDAAARGALALATRLLIDDRRGDSFAPRATVAADATPLLQFLAHLGRSAP